ncbi:malonyl-ACP O-methyltransferase BioC [Burkholderiaceae bacterium DAT-1]|nr:malonyl-ACP O-methyltransferase BioC [Burkholderiaceae bacterium DAT-1]
MSEAFYSDKSVVRRSFDKAATAYDRAAILQREVADRMMERLDLVKLKPARILDAGSGTGYAGPLLRKRYPDARLIELDLAMGMLAASRAKAGMIDKLLRKTPWQVCADLEAIPLANDSCDLIWSNLAFQWLNEPDQAFAECHRILRPEGLFMFSTLGPDTLKELRQAFASIDSVPHVNRFIDMHDLGDALSRAGFSAPVMDMEKIVMTYDEVRSVMMDLKAIGAHNAAQGRKRGLMGKTAWQSAVDAYDRLRVEGRLPATYEIVYGHAWKPQPKPADGAQVIRFMPRPGGSA